jgi:ParB/RepB/Spo0J family partition protein
VKLRVKEVTPNSYNSAIFEESLQPESIAELAENMVQRGQLSPIRVTRVGHVIIDGERRWRAAKSLKWTHIEVVEDDVPREEILDRVLEAISTQRQMTLLEQARVYDHYYKLLLKAKKKNQLTVAEMKRLAIKKARLPFRSPSTADQLVRIVNNGDADLHEKLLTEGASISALYDKLDRRTYGKPEPDNPPFPFRLDVLPEKEEPPPQEILTERVRKNARAFEAAELEEERRFAERYVEAHGEELQTEEAKAKLLALYEPDPPPAAKKFPDNDEARVIAEAFESLAVRETPEQLVGRLTAFIEDIVSKVREVDEERAYEVVVNVVKPMALRLGAQFPRQTFEVPVPVAAADD